MKLEAQEIVDWKEHPLTKNFEAGVNIHINRIKAILSDPHTVSDVEYIAKQKGILIGLEALLTYEPELTPEGEIVNYE